MGTLLKVGRVEARITNVIVAISKKRLRLRQVIGVFTVCVYGMKQYDAENTGQCDFWKYSIPKE